MSYIFRDRTGERYGKLTVLERAPDAVYPSGKLVRWRCKCDCGNETIVLGTNLSKTHSCGCEMHKGNLEDLRGRVFDLLTVIDYAGIKHLPCGQPQTLWRCKCSCGSIVTVRAATQKNGNTRSCGCVKSHGERRIAELLTMRCVSFKREFSFSDCQNSKGNPCKFDFAIFQSNHLLFLIEYQGEQHYTAPKRTPWFGSMQREETDKIKKEYCLTHNIPQYEIRYDEDIDLRIDDILNTLHDNTVPSSDDSEKV